MNFVDAYIYINTRFNEERTFWIFVSMMRHIRTLYLQGIPGFKKCVALIQNNIIKTSMPDLYRHFKILGIYRTPSCGQNIWPQPQAFYEKWKF